MEKKKKTNWFKIILSGLFIVYISLYFLNVSGYYDSRIRRKVEFTEEQIEQFERDVASGEAVDIKDYLKDQNKDYTNKASKFGYKLSTEIDKIVNGTIENIINVLSKLFTWNCHIFLKSCHIAYGFLFVKKTKKVYNVS